MNEAINRGCIKTLSGWEESGVNSFTDYVEVGDEVDEDIVDNFVNVLPPRSLRGDYVQMGEPYSHEVDSNGKYRATYMTFKKYDGKWYYIGLCFGGGYENRVNHERKTVSP